MSKIFQAFIALLIVFSFFATVAKAQESDFEGIVPTGETKPSPEVTFQEEPVETRTQRLGNLQAAEQAGFLSSKGKYATAKQMGMSLANSPDGANAINYKLNAILVSARYHRTLELYLSYLQKIDQSFINYNSTTGFEITGSETELNTIEQEINAISNLLSQYDTLVDSFAGTTDADISNVAPEIQSLSTAIKTQLNLTKTNMINLVEMAE